MADVKWAIRGEYMESCNCDYLCPCIYTNPLRPVTRRSGHYSRHASLAIADRGMDRDDSQRPAGRTPPLHRRRFCFASAALVHEGKGARLIHYRTVVIVVSLIATIIRLSLAAWAACHSWSISDTANSTR